MEFKIPKLLESENFLIRPLTKSDFEVLFKVASDPEIWKLHPIQNRYERSVFQQYFKTIFDFGGAMAVIDRKTNQIIGSSTYYNYNPKSKEIEIGYTFLQRSHWGGRSNWEVKKTLMDYAFQTVEKVLFFVGPNNIRSQKAMLKIGGKLLGPMTRPGPDGQPKTNLVYEIDKASFAEMKLKKEKESNTKGLDFSK